jgi:hypothetical protein
MTFEPLFTVVNTTILNRIGRCTSWAGWHDRRTAKNSTSPSLHLEHYQHHPPQQSFVCSMESIKRRVLNEQLLDTFISKLDLCPSLIKSHPNDQSLCSYGVIAA